MADGGASSFIFLVTALLVSGGVSAVLISQWGEMATTFDQQRRAEDADLNTEMDFAGDLSNVAYDDTLPTDEIITFYLQNTGEYELDEASLFIQLNGEIIPDTETTSTVLPSGTNWASGQLLEVEITGAWGFADNTEISLTVLVILIDIGGYFGETIVTEEVRLNVV
jgi:archaellum component FlaG (FlaF/FlaG flagellin family)